MTSTQISVPDGFAPAPANPQAKISSRQWITSIAVGVLLGGLFIGFDFGQSASPTDAADVERVVAYPTDNIEPDNYAISAAELSGYPSTDYRLIENISYYQSDPVGADWFAALAPYGRDWACTVTRVEPVVDRGSRIDGSQVTTTYIGNTLAEIENYWLPRSDPNRWRTRSFSDKVCRNSIGEIEVFPGDDDFRLIHISDAFPQVWGTEAN